jgi:hypothetical protein
MPGCGSSIIVELAASKSYVSSRESVHAWLKRIIIINKKEPHRSEALSESVNR